jgi:hypothetical protein
MTSPDSTVASLTIDKSSGMLFADALGVTIENERGYAIPELRAIVLRLGNSSTVRWIRQHDDTLERSSSRWCPVSAHVLIGSMAMVDECWPLAVSHFGAAATLFQTANDLAFPATAALAVHLRTLEGESRLEALCEFLKTIPETGDDCGARVLDAFTRFTAIFWGVDKEWDAQDRFLARALSLFEPLQGLSREISDAQLLELGPLVQT